MKTLAELILSAGERTQLEYDGLRYRALVNAMDEGRVAVIIDGALHERTSTLDSLLDWQLNPSSESVRLSAN